MACCASALTVAFMPAPAAHAVAPGCTSSRPTAIGGGIFGYPDNRSLNALIGVDLHAGTTDVYADGSPNTTGGYSYSESVNKELPPEGTTATVGYERIWGDPGQVDEYLCIAANVTQVFIEVYPRRRDAVTGGMVTDKSRYGEASHYRQPITSGATNTINLRLPLRHELGGNTGYVNGYITYNGRPVPDPLVPGDPNRIAHVRVWPATTTSGPQCGVEGFSADYDTLGLSGSGAATFYRVDALAGGRCGAVSQSYRIDVYCDCDGQRRVLSRPVEIEQDRGDRVDFGFTG